MFESTPSIGAVPEARSQLHPLGDYQVADFIYYCHPTNFQQSDIHIVDYFRADLKHTVHISTLASR